MAGSGLRLGDDLFVCHSPERVFSGRIFEDLRKYPKLIGGLDDPSSKRAAEFYEAVLDFDERPDLARGNGVWDLGSVEAAELAKLAETTYRDVNIALANTFAMYADSIGVDVFGVIEASNSQPFSHVHQPGIAVGGHCIPVYPRFYLSGDPSASLVAVARDVNETMPGYAVSVLSSMLESIAGRSQGRRSRSSVRRTAVASRRPRSPASSHSFVGSPRSVRSSVSTTRCTPTTSCVHWGSSRSISASDAMRRSCRPTTRSTGRSDRSTCRERRPSSTVVVCCRRASSRRRAFQCGYSVVSEAELTGHTTDVFDRVPSRWIDLSLTWLERGYAVFLLAALTQGPVLSLWWRTTQAGQASGDFAIASTYTAIQIPAVFLLGRRFDRVHLPMGVVVPFALLVGWLVASTFWSTLRIDTAVAATSLAVTTIVGLYLAVSFEVRTLIAIVLVAMQPGLIASEWALQREWPEAYELISRDWAGIYYNRNSLGPPAVIGMIAAAVLIWLLVRTRPRAWPVGVVVLVAVFAFDFRLQKGGGSATAWAVVAVFAIVFVGWSLIAFWRRREGLPLTRAFGWAYVIGLFSIAVVGLVLRNVISSILGRPAGFDGRVEYWRVSWDGVEIHPLRGWGWLAAWRTPSFRTMLPVELANELWSHSAFLDVLLGGGLVAGVLLVIGLSRGLVNAALFASSDALVGAWPLAIATAILAASTQESFIIGNHFYWALLVAACVVPLGQPLSATRETEPHDPEGERA